MWRVLIFSSYLDVFFFISFIRKSFLHSLHIFAHTMIPREWEPSCQKREDGIDDEEEDEITHERRSSAALPTLDIHGSSTCIVREQTVAATERKRKAAQRKKNNSTERRKRKKRGEKLMAIINLPLHFEWQVKVGGVATRHRHGSAAILFSTTSLNSSPFSLRRFVCESFLIKKERTVSAAAAADSNVMRDCELFWVILEWLKIGNFLFLFSFSVCYVFWWAEARTCDVMWNFNMGTFHLKNEIKNCKQPEQ